VTDIIESVPKPKQSDDVQQLAAQLVERARAEGVDLVGPGRLLTGLTKTVLETALEAEMSEHLGYDKHDRAGRIGGNSRNGTRAKTVLTEVGPVPIEVSATGTAASSRSSCVSGSVGWSASTSWCCRCRRAG
jgi:putative transposase